MIIRLDYFFMKNLCLDFMLMVTVNKIMQKRVHIVRIFAGCISINLCYLAIEILTMLETPDYYIWLLVLTALLIYVNTYKAKELKKQISLWKYSLLVLIAAGGGALGICGLWKKERIGFGYVLMITGAVCVCLYRALVYDVENVRFPQKQEYIYEICFQRGEKRGTGKAFYDTGNQLMSMMNGRGIAVVTWKLASQLLSEKEKEEYLRRKETMKKIKERGFHEIKKKNSRERKTDGFYQIIYQTIGNDCGVMPGVLVDEVRIKTREGDIVTKSILIGISPTDMLKRKRCDCLLPADIFESKNRKAERR